MVKNHKCQRRNGHCRLRLMAESKSPSFTQRKGAFTTSSMCALRAQVLITAAAIKTWPRFLKPKPPYHWFWMAYGKYSSPDRGRVIHSANRHQGWVSWDMKLKSNGWQQPWHTRYAAALWKYHRNAGEEQQESPEKKIPEWRCAGQGAGAPPHSPGRARGS